MRLSPFIISLTPLFATTQLVFAQDRLDTITVTTTTIGDSEITGIGNTTIYSRDDIVESLGSNLGDSLSNEPGVSGSSFGQGASRPILRGLGAERVLVLSNGLGAIDVSAASPDHQVATDPLDATQIEILRGPEALAYGGQAIGGVVNVLDDLIGPSQNDTPLEAEALALFDSVNDGETFAGRLVGNNGPFRAVVSFTARDLNNYDIPGFAESAAQRALEETEESGEHSEEEEVQGLVENSFSQTTAFSGGLTWSNDTSYLGVSIREQKADYGLVGHTHAHEEEGEHSEEEEEEAPFIDLQQTRITLQGGHGFGRNTGLTQVDFALMTADYEHTEFEAPGEAGTLYERDGTEARVNALIQTPSARYTIGASLIDTTLAVAGEEAFVPSTDSQQIGAYILRHWKNAAGLHLDGGINVSSVERDTVTGQNADFTPISGSATLSKDISEFIKLGGQLSYTERAPSETELFANGAHLATQQFEIGDPNLSLEKAISFEVKASYVTKNMGFGANLYASDFSDFIYLTPSSTQTIAANQEASASELPVVSYVQNDAEFYGGEIYAQFDWDDAFLGADIRTEFALDFVSADLSNDTDVPFVPPTRLLIDMEADWAFGAVGAALIIAGSQDDPGIGQLPTNDYTRLDLSAELMLGHWVPALKQTHIIAQIGNLFDEEIRHATSSIKDLAPEPGQNFRIGLRSRF